MHGVALDGSEDQIFDDQADHDRGQQPGERGGNIQQAAVSWRPTTTSMRLYAATGNLALWDLVRIRGGHIDRLRRLHLPSPGKAQDIVRHHKLIVTAIGANQPDDAQRRLRKHLSGTLGYLAKIRNRFPKYLSE